MGSIISLHDSIKEKRQKELATEVQEEKTKKSDAKKKRADTRKMNARDKKFLEQVSVFEKEAGKLSKMVGHKAGFDVESQQVALQAIRSAVLMYLDIIPKAERVFNMYKNERAAYALVAVTGTLRELLKDLSALSSVSKIGERIIEGAVDPALINMAQGHISALKEIKQAVYEKVDDRKLQKRLIKRIDRIISAETSHIHEVRTQVTEQIEEVINKK